jgi:UDP-GlcNAc:undecaprenyl-phosphate/decaprenyl-phosphate GlcNAc-1-phosphate transferase
MASTLFFSFLGSMLICMALIPPLMASAGRLHFLDLPGGRKGHPAPIAKVGGIALAAGTFTAMLLWAPKDEIALAGLLGGAVILMFGVWDDRVGLGYLPKLFGQLIVAGLVLWIGGIHPAVLPFLPEGWSIWWLTGPIMFLLVVGVTNAINLADGLDGLAGGLSLISFAGMAYLAYLADDAVIMLMMVPVLGGLLGFLRFNTYPARIFMGDAGSQFLGFYLGFMALVLTDPTRGPYSPLLALFLWGLPLLDTMGVMIQRLREGRSPFIGDRNHLHHKLLGMGFSHHSAVILIYLVQVGLIVLAYVLRWQPDWLLAVLYLAIAGTVLSLFLMSGPSWIPRGSQRDAPFPKWVAFRSTLQPWVAVRSRQWLAVAVVGLLFLIIFLPGSVPSDVGVGAAGLLVVMGGGFLLFPRSLPYLVRAGLYVGSTGILYFAELQGVAEGASWLQPVNIYFAVLAILVMVSIRVKTVHRFETTPLDSLMVFLAVLVPFLPELRVGTMNVSVLTAKLIVLFFSFELLLHADSDRLWRSGVLAAWLLVGLTLHAWW